MEIDIPEVKAEVEAAFYEYERALISNDVPVLQALFRRDPRTLRFGAGGENLHGWEEIAAFRAGRAPTGLERTLENTIVTTFGRDFGVANTEFIRNGRRGRQSHTWVRFPDDGWRIVAAHVSVPGV
jgi:hypothetical protein